MKTKQNLFNFTVGPRIVTAIYDRTKRRLIVRAFIHNGERVCREKSPELWQELRDDFLSIVPKK